MAGIERRIPGVPTPRPELRNGSLGTASKEDRSKRPEDRCKVLRFPRGNEGPISRELYPQKDINRASYWSGFRLLERLVSPELYQRESEGIDLNLVVLHNGAENISDASRPALALEFGMIRRIRRDFDELNPCRIRRLSKVIENHVLDLDINERLRGITDERIDHLVLPLLLNHGALHIPVHEIE
jgi:hypothetical protein